MQLLYVTVFIVGLTIAVSIHPSNARASSSFQASRRAFNRNTYDVRLMDFLRQKRIEDQDESEESAELERRQSATVQPMRITGPPHGGNGGTLKDNSAVYGGSTIYLPKTILMYCTWVTDSWQLSSIYINYQTLNGTAVGTLPSNLPTPTISLDLNPGERIVQVGGRAGSLVNRLYFVTNQGRTTNGCNSGNGGTAFLEEQPGYVLSYISGRGGTMIDQITLNWVKVPPVCATPCRNGGQCIGTGVCECPVGWAGCTCETYTNGIIIGIGTEGALYSRPNLAGTWTRSASLQGTAKGIAILNDGTILGIDANGKLQTRASLNTDWVPATNQQGTATAITILKDGTILGIDANGKLQTRASLNSDWVPATNQQGTATAIAVLKDGTILGADANGKLQTRASLDSDWVPATNQQGQAKSLAVFRDGSILCSGTDGTLYTRASLNAEWTPASNQNGAVTAIAIMVN